MGNVVACAARSIFLVQFPAVRRTMAILANRYLAMPGVAPGTGQKRMLAWPLLQQAVSFGVAAGACLPRLGHGVGNC